MDHAIVEGHRDGRTYEPGLDYDRLNAQAKRVVTVMLDGQWHTLRGVSEATGDPEASISAMTLSAASACSVVQRLCLSIKLFFSFILIPLFFSLEKLTHVNVKTLVNFYISLHDICAQLFCKNAVAVFGYRD